MSAFVHNAAPSGGTWPRHLPRFWTQHPGQECLPLCSDFS